MSIVRKSQYKRTFFGSCFPCVKVRDIGIENIIILFNTAMIKLGHDNYLIFYKDLYDDNRFYCDKTGTIILHINSQGIIIRSV